VLNEASTVDALLNSVARQSVAPDEIVVVDGGSTDATIDRLQDWSRRLPVRLITRPGSNISAGRNAAIRATTAELVAVTDAGVVLDPDWLARLKAGLTPETDVVAGFFEADPHTIFERSLGATTLPAIEDVNPERFLPSSRSVLFRRGAWQTVGGYPEWLDYGEDLVFDLALKRAVRGFAFAPEAVAWFRPRRSLAAFFRQYFLYARGDGKAGLWPRRHAIRYATYAFTAFVLFRRSRLRWLLPLGVVVYTWRPYQRLGLDGLSRRAQLTAIAMVPVIRLVGDVAKMLGYPVGVGWRVRRAWTSPSSS
jgi:glycosyltransferase involved in cell wall biosynthesis